MEHQVRRGIYRQNAQRLSIALAPVAAHRSMLFNRVRADLATKASYSELLSPTSNDSDSEYEPESPALFMLTPQPQKMSAIISARSAASMYSQDSWGGRSPFVTNDNRRHAIALSPSLQLADLLNEGNIMRARPLPNLPLRSAPSHSLPKYGFAVVPSPQSGLFEALTPKIETVTEPASQVLDVPEIHIVEHEEPTVTISKHVSLAEVAPIQNNPELVMTTLDDTKGSSKRAKTFSKVLSRISMQTSKKEFAQRVRTESISHPMPLLSSLPSAPPAYSVDDLKLTLPEVPEVEPFRMSFIAKAASRPITFTAMSTCIEEEGPVPKKRLSPTEARDKERRRRTTMPPPPSAGLKRTLASPMLAVPPMALKAPPPRRPTIGQHRRFQSSPTVMQTQFEGLPPSQRRVKSRRRWDPSNMPPLPPLPPIAALSYPIKAARPPLPQVPLRTKSHNVGGPQPM